MNTYIVTWRCLLRGTMHTSTTCAYTAQEAAYQIREIHGPSTIEVDQVYMQVERNLWR